MIRSIWQSTLFLMVAMGVTAYVGMEITQFNEALARDMLSQPKTKRRYVVQYKTFQR